VVTNRLAEAEQAIFLAKGEKMLEQARAMVGSQFTNQNGVTMGCLACFGCTAEIFVGYGSDGLAQFERIHLVSFFSDRYKNSTDAVYAHALSCDDAPDPGKH